MDANDSTPSKEVTIGSIHIKEETKEQNQEVRTTAETEIVSVEIDERGAACIKLREEIKCVIDGNNTPVIKHFIRVHPDQQSNEKDKLDSEVRMNDSTATKDQIQDINEEREIADSDESNGRNNVIELENLDDNEHKKKMLRIG